MSDIFHVPNGTALWVNGIDGEDHSQDVLLAKCSYNVYRHDDEYDEDVADVPREMCITLHNGGFYTYTDGTDAERQHVVFDNVTREEAFEYLRKMVERTESEETEDAYITLMPDCYSYFSDMPQFEEFIKDNYSAELAHSLRAGDGIQLQGTFIDEALIYNSRSKSYALEGAIFGGWNHEFIQRLDTRDMTHDEAQKWLNNRGASVGVGWNCGERFEIDPATAVHFPDFVQAYKQEQVEIASYREMDLDTYSRNSQYRTYTEEKLIWSKASDKFTLDISTRNSDNELMKNEHTTNVSRAAAETWLRQRGLHINSQQEIKELCDYRRSLDADFTGNRKFAVTEACAEHFSAFMDEYKAFENAVAYSVLYDRHNMPHVERLCFNEGVNAYYRYKGDMYGERLTQKEAEEWLSGRLMTCGGDKFQPTPLFGEKFPELAHDWENAQNVLIDVHQRCSPDEFINTRLCYDNENQEFKLYTLRENTSFRREVTYIENDGIERTSNRGYDKVQTMSRESISAWLKENVRENSDEDYRVDVTTVSVDERLTLDKEPQSCKLPTYTLTTGFYNEDENRVIGEVVITGISSEGAEKWAQERKWTFDYAANEEKAAIDALNELNEGKVAYVSVEYKTSGFIPDLKGEFKPYIQEQNKTPKTQNKQATDVER